MEYVYGALVIMCLKIADVSLGTIRMLTMVQGKRLVAGILAFIEVTIWIFALRFIMLHLDNIFNIFAYSGGFALGTVLGMSIEKKLGSGFVQLQIISTTLADKIAEELRGKMVGVTIVPGEGRKGLVSILILLIKRRRQNEIIKLIESIDPNCFISIQPTLPLRGFVQMRK